MRYRSSERERRCSLSRSRSHSMADRSLLFRSTRKPRTKVDYPKRSRSHSHSRSHCHSRSHSHSASRERYLVNRQQRSPSASCEHYLSREHYLHREKRVYHQQRGRSPSASREHYLHRSARYVSGSPHSDIRRSRSRSVEASRLELSRRRCNPTSRRRNSHTRQRSSSLRSFEDYSSCQRSRDTYRRSQSPRGRSPTPRRLYPNRSRFVERRSPSYRRSSPNRLNSSLQVRYSTRSPCERSAHSRNRSISVRRQSHSPRRHRMSRSRSLSSQRRDASASAHSKLSRGLSKSPDQDTLYAVAEQPQTSLKSISLESACDVSSDSKHDEKMMTKIESKGTDDHRVSTTGSYEDCSTFHALSHHHLLSHSSHNDRTILYSQAPHGSSSLASPLIDLKRVTVSTPRGSLTPTPSQPTSGDRSHSLVNPALEKRLEAQRESHRAYLKSKSDYNRVEMKNVSIEGELRLAEFWLGVVTKNMEDVGKRIEVHDWNFQKITNQGGFDEQQ